MRKTKEDKEYWKDYRWEGRILKLGGRTVGIVDKSKSTYWRTGSSEYIHKLRVPPGWAIDKRCIQDLHKMEIKEVAIPISKVLTICASLEDFLKYGISIDRNHGPQLVLMDTYWRRVGH